MNRPLVAQQAALRGLQASIWTAMPAILQSYSAAKMTCEVQPAIKGELQAPDGTWSAVQMPLLVDCPVVFPGGGGFLLTFPLAKGDEGLVIFASRCIDGWWQSGGVQSQVEFRMHNLSDGFFIPGVRSQAHLPPAPSGSTVQLRSEDGNTFVEMAGGGVINLKATTVNIDGNVHVTGDVVAGTVSLRHHLQSGVTAGGGTSGPPVP